jgi:hypothetical protein
VVGLVVTQFPLVRHATTTDGGSLRRVHGYCADACRDRSVPVGPADLDPGDDAPERVAGGARALVHLLDGAVYVDTQAGSFKYRNVERDDRVCCLVEAGGSYLELRGVMIEGRASVVTDETERKRVQEALAAKAARIGSGLGEMPAHFSGSRRQRSERGERILLRIPLERVRSWDFGKVRQHYRRAPEP